MSGDVSLKNVCDESIGKIESLRAAIRRFESALIAFSGGVDSTFLLKVAKDELGDRVTALTATSASLPKHEAEDALIIARRLGVAHISVDSCELANPNYAANPVNRCYFCKSELFTICENKRKELNLAVVLDGCNADDKVDYRPGRQAGIEHRVFSPLADAGLTKKEVRAWSQELGLPTWDKPQLACLASRIPYGTAVTAERLSQIADAEADIRALGFRNFRVRYHGDVARIEVASEEYDRFLTHEFRDRVNKALRGRGFSFVAVDLEPFRTGRMNEGLATKASSKPTT